VDPVALFRLYLVTALEVHPVMCLC
jgi:hypothetical protein